MELTVYIFTLEPFVFRSTRIELIGTIELMDTTISRFMIQSHEIFFYLLHYAD